MATKPMDPITVIQAKASKIVMLVNMIRKQRTTEKEREEIGRLIYEDAVAIHGQATLINNIAQALNREVEKNVEMDKSKLG